MDSQKARMVFDDSLHYLCPEDIEAASKYLKEPQEYVFKNILNWD
jgi:6-phosphofructokinase 1